MKVVDAIRGIDNVISELEGQFTTEILATHGHDLAVMIANRVLMTATNHNGEKFSPYSTRPIYINTIKNSPRKLIPKGKSGFTVFRKSGKTHRSTYFSGGYKEFREIIGRSTDKNFELFAGAKGMWNNFDVIRIEKKGGKFVATLGGSNEESQMKINKNSDHEGYPIILPSEKELKAIEETMHSRILELFNNYL